MIVAKIMQVKQFKDMLKEIDKESINQDITWLEIKKKLKNDPRYKAIGSKTQREKLFQDHQAEIMNEREEQLILTRKRSTPEEDKTQTIQEEQQIFNELLNDYIKQQNLTWFDAVKLIEKDKRYGELSSFIASMPYAYKDYMRNYK